VRPRLDYFFIRACPQALLKSTIYLALERGKGGRDAVMNFRTFTSPVKSTLPSATLSYERVVLKKGKEEKGGRKAKKDAIDRIRCVQFYHQRFDSDGESLKDLGC